MAVYNSIEEKRSSDEVSMGSILVLVSYSVFIRRGSSYSTDELVFGSFQDLSVCLQDATMGRAHSVMGS